jgi:hypothetical protein
MTQCLNASGSSCQIRDPKVSFTRSQDEFKVFFKVEEAVYVSPRGTRRRLAGRGDEESEKEASSPRGRDASQSACWMSDAKRMPDPRSRISDSRACGHVLSDLSVCLVTSQGKWNESADIDESGCWNMQRRRFGMLDVSQSTCPSCRRHRSRTALPVLCITPVESHSAAPHTVVEIEGVISADTSGTFAHLRLHV